MDIKWINFQEHGDERGMLVSLEYSKEVPFDIKRVYYMYATKFNIHRGYHAHKSLQQILVCVSGSCKLLLDDGNERTVVSLDSPCKGIYISNFIWREMFDFSSDAVLLVLASDLYDESDYIRDYQEFQKYQYESRKK